MFDGAVQLGQIEERDGWKHVMFDVVLHIPVEERRQPGRGVRAAAETMVRDVRRQADVLRRTAESAQQGAIL